MTDTAGRIMVAVISDLHFEEEEADILRGERPDETFRLVRNVPSEVFRSMTADLVEMARRNGVAKIILVLAGDIFDLNRTQLWLRDETSTRPWIACEDVAKTRGLETMLLSLLDRIEAEDRVGKSIDVIVKFGQGQIYADDGKLQPIGITCELRYLPGNHDRLVDATPALRQRVREILHLPSSDARFVHQFLFSDPPLLVRHGHEYDRFNFSRDLSQGPISAEIDPTDYDQPSFGDFVTVMIASRLPYCFRDMYRYNGSDRRVIQDPLLRLIYCRLLQFDDVRPQSAVVDFFLKTQVPRTIEAPSKRRAWRAMIWKALEPAVRKLLDEATRDTFFMRESKRLFPLSYYLLLRLRPWRFGIPLWAVQVYARFKRTGAQDDAVCAALREEALKDGSVRFVSAGHTHSPRVIHLSTEGTYKTFFTDTGTWRNAVLAAAGDRSSYGRVNATTYVVFYGAGEGDAPKVERGFEFWTGFDQMWPVDQYDR